MIYKNRQIEEFNHNKIKIFIDEDGVLAHFYNSDLRLKYVYTNDKKLNKVNNASTVSMYDDFELRGYFATKISFLREDISNYQKYDRYIDLLEFGINLNDRTMVLLLIDYLKYYAKTEGTTFIRVNKVYEEFSYFYELLEDNYNAKLIDGSYYIEVECPINYLDLEHLRIYEDDSISIDLLYYLYYIGYRIEKDVCRMTFYNKDELVINRKDLKITLPESIINLNEQELYAKNNIDIYFLLYFINTNYHDILKNKLEIGYKINNDCYAKLKNKLIASKKEKYDYISIIDFDDVDLINHIKKLNINEIILFSSTDESENSFYYNVERIK